MSFEYRGPVTLNGACAHSKVCEATTCNAHARSSAPNRNIKSVRDFLRQSQKKRSLIFWLAAGFIGNNNNSAVACTAIHTGKTESTLTSVAKAPLASVMECLPLRRAFREFCRMALCTEVRRCASRRELARYAQTYATE